MIGYHHHRLHPLSLYELNPQPTAPDLDQLLAYGAKLYMWDWSLCDDPAARFENLVACQLLKYCHHLEDTEGEPMSLRFLRDSAGREIDFIVMRGNKPVFAVECKTGERELSRNIPYFAARSGIPIFYQVHGGTRNIEHPESRARILPLTLLAGMLKV